MSDPRWTVDEWGYLRWDSQVIYRGEGPYPLKYEAAYDALVAAVRDTARLPAITAERDALRELVEAQRSLTLLVNQHGDPDILVAAAKRIEAAERALDREPQPTDGPDYHAEHQTWIERQASSPGTETPEVGK